MLWASTYLARTLARRPSSDSRSELFTVVTDGLETARALGLEVMEANLRAIEVAI